MLVTVTREDLASAVYHGGLMTIAGTDDAGNHVRFAGDTRMMDGLIDEVYQTGEAVADVATWAIVDGPASVYDWITDR